MDLSKLPLKPRYSSKEVELLRDFWIPLLSNSIIYKRGVGYFRSIYLVSAVNGLIKFIENGGRARMICGVEFTKEDAEAIQYGYKQRDQLIEEKLLKEITEIHSIRTKTPIRNFIMDDKKMGL